MPPNSATVASTAAFTDSSLVTSHGTGRARPPDSVMAAVREIATAAGAVLVHCAAGKDRTGTIVAVALEAAGAPRELIAEDYLASGQRIERIIERLCSSETYRHELEGHDPQRHAPVPGTIERVLQIVEAEHGGAADWLLANGFTDDELALLRERLAPAARGW